MTGAVALRTSPSSTPLSTEHSVLRRAAELLDGWNGGWLPAKVRPLLPQALAEADVALRPASPAEFAHAVKLVADWCRAHEINVSGEKLAPVWKGLLGELPADLLLSGVRAVLADQVMHVIPKPGQVRDAVESVLTQRRATKFLIDRAEFYARHNPDEESRAETTPEGREKVKAMFATLRRSLAMKPDAEMDADQREAAKLPPDERAEFWKKRLGA